MDNNNKDQDKLVIHNGQLKFVDCVTCIDSPVAKPKGRDDEDDDDEINNLETCYYLGFLEGNTKRFLLLSGVQLSISLRLTVEENMGSRDISHQYEAPLTTEQKKRKAEEDPADDEGENSKKFFKKRKNPDGSFVYTADAQREEWYKTISDSNIKRAFESSFFFMVKTTPWLYDPVLFHYIGVEEDRLTRDFNIVSGITYVKKDGTIYVKIMTNLLPFFIFLLSKVGGTIRLCDKVYNITEGSLTANQSEVDIQTELMNIYRSDEKHKRRILAECALNHYTSIERIKASFDISHKYDNRRIVSSRKAFMSHDCNARIITNVTRKWYYGEDVAEMNDEEAHYFTSNLISNHIKFVKKSGDTAIKQVPEYRALDIPQKDGFKFTVARFEDLNIVKYLGSVMNANVFEKTRKARTGLDKAKNKLSDLLNELRTLESKRDNRLLPIEGSESLADKIEEVKRQIEEASTEKKTLQEKSAEKKARKIGINTLPFTY